MEKEYEPLSTRQFDPYRCCEHIYSHLGSYGERIEWHKCAVCEGLKTFRATVQHGIESSVVASGSFDLICSSNLISDSVHGKTHIVPVHIEDSALGVFRTSKRPQRPSVTNPGLPQASTRCVVCMAMLTDPRVDPGAARSGSERLSGAFSVGERDGGRQRWLQVGLLCLRMAWQHGKAHPACRFRPSTAQTSCLSTFHGHMPRMF